MIAIKIPKTHYIPRSYAKHLIAEYPLGNARSGAPFKQKNDPITIAVSAGTIMTGITALETSLLVGGLLIAGGAMSAIGSITGNKTLSTLGAVASLAGGIGSGLQGAAGTAGEGGFWNPFSENSIAFSNTKFGQAFKGVTDAFSSGPSQADALVDVAEGTTASDLVDKSKSLSNNINPELQYMDGAPITASAKFASASDSIKGALTGSEAGKSGLLSNASSMFGDKGLMGAVSGAADAYQNQPLIDAQVNRYEELANNDKFTRDMKSKQMANMNAQPTVNIGVNPNAQIFNEQPAQQGKYAVAINGEVKYLSQAEYDAVKQQQSQAGLLQQGAAA